MRYADAQARAGISHRQGDYWRSAGYVHATAEGSGTVSEITPTEAQIMLRIAQLVRVGMKAAQAAQVARASVEQHVRAVDLIGGLRIVFPTEGSTAEQVAS